MDEEYGARTSRSDRQVIQFRMVGVVNCIDIDCNMEKYSPFIGRDKTPEHIGVALNGIYLNDWHCL